MEFLRQRVQALGQQRQRVRVHGDLAGLGLEHRALHTDDVTDVQGLEIPVSILADVVALDVDLHRAVRVLDAGEAGLAHDVLAQYAAGDANGLALQRVVLVPDQAGGVGAVIGGDLVGVPALFDQRVQLAQANGVLFGEA